MLPLWAILLIIGIILALLVAPTIGLICIVIALIFLVVDYSGGGRVR